MSKIGKGQQLRLRAIVTRDRNDASSLEKRASLLRYDSVHGDFEGSVNADVENNTLIINGTTVHIITAGAPEEIDYTQYGIEDALVIDNTGAFTTEEALKRHLSSKGVDKVLLTAPGKGVPNIVYGVNHEEYNPDEVNIYSAASCTTNAITPVLKAIEDTLGVVKGHLETIHAYTNDQNLVDNMHKKYSSKLGLEIVLPIVIVFATIIVLAAFDDQGWVVLSIISPIAVFIAYTFLNTYYIIQDDNLIIKSGFIYHQKINIKTITKIESTKSIISAPATSLDRIEISFNN